MHQSELQRLYAARASSRQGMESVPTTWWALSALPASVPAAAPVLIRTLRVLNAGPGHQRQEVHVTDSIKAPPPTPEAPPTRHSTQGVRTSRQARPRSGSSAPHARGQAASLTGHMVAVMESAQADSNSNSIVANPSDVGPRVAFLAVPSTGFVVRTCHRIRERVA